MDQIWYQRHLYSMIVQLIIPALNVYRHDFLAIGVLMHIVVHMTRLKIAEMIFW